jgi:hypothetical protein
MTVPSFLYRFWLNAVGVVGLLAIAVSDASPASASSLPQWHLLPHPSAAAVVFASSALRGTPARRLNHPGAAVRAGPPAPLAPPLGAACRRSVENGAPPPRRQLRLGGWSAAAEQSRSSTAQRWGKIWIGRFGVSCAGAALPLVRGD